MTSIALVETIFLFVSVNSVSLSSDFEATTAALPMPLRRSDILEVLWPRHRSWMRAHVVTERLKLLCRRQILIVKCSPSLQQLRTIMAGLSRCHRVWATYWRWFGSLADLGSLPCMSPGHHGGQFYPGSWHDLKLNQRQQLSSRSGQNPDISAPSMFVFVLHVDSFLSSIQISLLFRPKMDLTLKKEQENYNTKCSVL